MPVFVFDGFFCQSGSLEQFCTYVKYCVCVQYCTPVVLLWVLYSTNIVLAQQFNKAIN